MRKRLLILLLISSLSWLSLRSDAQGIHFFKGNWNELLDVAKKQHKLIFIDFYTDWCAPCKRIENEIFPMPEVGTAYNHQLICYRLNAEKKEGPSIARQYAIHAYPTYLFLNEKGEILLRKEDYMPADQFIALIGEAEATINKKDNLADLQNRFGRGERDTIFLQLYLDKLKEMEVDNRPALDAYVAEIPKEKLKEPGNVSFLCRHLGRSMSDAVPIIIAALPKLSTKQRMDAAAALYHQSLYEVLGNAIKDNRKNDAALALAYINKLRPYITEKISLSADNLELYYCKTFGDTSDLKKVGYRIANKLMAINITTIREQDKSMLDKVMEPFLTGKQDSTKIPGFESAKKLAATQFSGQIATLLYTVADAFRVTLPATNPALKDASVWAARALELLPSNKAIRQLAGQIKNGR